MSGIIECKRFFPIDSIQKVCDLFQEQLRSEKEPDLALFSIIIGAVENNLTNSKNSDKDVILSANKFIKMKFPCVEWEDVKSLHERFVSLMKGGVDAKLLNGEYATRELEHPIGINSKICYGLADVGLRLRDERGDMERVMAMDKAREGSHNGSSPGHSPVLNLSKSGSGDRDRSDRGDRDSEEE